MTTWTRARRKQRCGYCGETIRVGEPMVEMRFRGPLMRDGEIVAEMKTTAVKVRCGKFACAGEAIPEHIPEHVLPTIVAPSGLSRLTADMLPLDFKQGAGGE